MRVFPYLVALLDIGASCVYIYNKQYALAITWGCYGVAASALGSIR